MKKTIFTSLSPNVEKDDFFLSLGLIFCPWKWKQGNAVQRLRKQFSEMFRSQNIFFFESGRTSLRVLLESLHLGPDDEVLLQAYTCVAVPNAIVWAGARPRWVDCDSNLNMSTDDLEKKISSKSRAIIIQHTFGRAADIEEILDIARKNGLYVIEDCAHALGNSYKGKLLGTFSDASFFSFGRDKTISSVFGGMLLVNTPKNVSEIQKMYDFMEYPSMLWIFRQLLHPVITFVAKKTYTFFSLGKVIMKMVFLFHILSKAVYPEEKKSKKPYWTERKFPNALAVLAQNQMNKLEKFQKHRKKLSEFYDQKLKNLQFETVEQKSYSPLRYVIFSKSQKEIIKKAAVKGIFLGDWYSYPIAPSGVQASGIFFSETDTPRAVKFSKISINLPTSISISENDAQSIIDFLKKL